MSKIAMIGAGSIVFCKTLMSDIMATPALAGSEFALMSRTEPKLRSMEDFGRRMLRDNGLPGSVWATLDRREAIHKALELAGPGDLVFKPRGEWHTFWNAGDEPCRILEIISPAGFERFFAELVVLGGVAAADPETLSELLGRYELEMDPGSIPMLIERFGVRLG